MLNPEQAAERLKAFKIKDADVEKQSLQRAAALPETVRPLAYALLGHRPDGSEAHRAAQKLRSQAIAQMESLESEARIGLFEAVFPGPGVGRGVEAAWHLFPRLPYQIGWTRKAFRAPRSPEIYRAARQEWLSRLLQVATYYAQDLVWYAQWAPYLGWAADTLGILFAAAIDAGGPTGEAVFDSLIASARGEHEIGAMGRHVTRSLLVASRPEGWEFTEKLLLAAQRQEGLRQTILETVDEAHPEAFRRMLRLIAEHDLTRFNATLRALDVWLGFHLNVLTTRAADEAISQVLTYLEDPQARDAALAGETGQALYLALYALARQDAVAAIPPAIGLLQDPNVERRFVAVHFLSQLKIAAAREALLPMLDDPDLRVAWAAFKGLNIIHGQAALIDNFDDLAEGLDIYADAALNIHYAQVALPDAFERLERLIPRLPAKPKECEPIVWPWMTLTLTVHEVADTLPLCLGQRSPRRLIAYVKQMEPYSRMRAVKAIAGQKKWDAETREALFTLLGDTHEWVRRDVLEALKKCAVTPQEAAGIERLLTRKSDDLRRGVLSLLLTQPDTEALSSAERLLASSQPLQRQAGLDLLQQMVKAERSVDLCRAGAERYRASARSAETEARLLDALLDREREIPTLDNALGLLDNAQRTRPIPPRRPEHVCLISETSQACLKSLDALIQKHPETPIFLEQWDGSKKEELLGNAVWTFPMPNPNLPPEEDAARLPLREVWETWWRERPDSQRDPDGCDLLRLYAGLFAQPSFYYLQSVKGANWQWQKDLFKTLYADLAYNKYHYPALATKLVAWLTRLYPPVAGPDMLLDAVETTFALIPEEQHLGTSDPNSHYNAGWRDTQCLLGWLAAARWFCGLCPEVWQESHHRRLWRLLRWMDEPAPGAERHRPLLGEVLTAYKLGEATEADLLDQLLGPRPDRRYYGADFAELRLLSGRKPSPLFQEYPILKTLVDRCRERIIEVELHRGDTPTAASAPANQLRSVGGLETLARLLPLMGKEPFVRGGSGSALSKSSVFSHLLQVTFPGPDDTPQAFAARMQAAKIPARRLVELAVYAPQWANYVERTLEWPEFAEGVWWIHAHTKDSQWRVDLEIREEWNAQVSERTPLAGQSLLDGAVDVAWFHRVYTALGPERWAQLDEAAKYASGGGGHKRAQLFADAMLGRITREELLGRIVDKRNPDSVRALGLLPLASANERQAETSRSNKSERDNQQAPVTAREQDLLGRYKIIQEFLRTSRQFGAQRQATEKLAATIGLENLARTAGYPDPARLEWAMEAQAVADLANGPITATADEVTVTLRIDALGRPELTYSRQGKPLKSLPPKARKDPAIAELVERRRDIERQASRMRLSLEQAMCRGDRFTGAELHELLAHPILAPMLRSLVFVGDGIAGYLIDGGRALESHDGACLPIDLETRLGIAHPYDLLGTGAWPQWQKDCFRRERIQPFKQVFRELYVLTDTEQVEATRSRRYEGHQVNPQQALALLGKRGWVIHPEEGTRRTFHDQNLSACLTFFEGFLTPAEVGGLTLDQVYFTRRGEWKPLELAQVPPRVFSEAMRDLDLVVSVAHLGGVDPEASASTVEMRAALIRETGGLLHLDNIRFQGTHVLIDGHLGTYSVHLGSAVVHRQPGGHLCIVPVHSQHRGRLFLPFADDDPKTAEVLSKVLLLAKDKEIKDPTILEQILPRA